MNISNKTIITQLKGGLGNQMFRYAAGKALAAEKGFELQIDISFLIANSTDHGDFIARPYELGIFPAITEKVIDIDKQHQPLLWRKVKRKLGIGSLSVPVYKETSFAFNNSFVEVEAPTVLDGDLQSEKYFKRHKELIRKSFRFQNLPSNDPNNALIDFAKKETVISVHVRRGDYLNAYNSAINGICSKDYYETTIKMMRDRFPDATFFFFSNDMEWVKQELTHLTDRCRFIEGNTSRNSWKDMYLMSVCKHNIIANSSFSWWGAWLNVNVNKTVIAPSRWFNSCNPFYNTSDLLPENWIKI
jgi:hypothetical protein